MAIYGDVLEAFRKELTYLKGEELHWRCHRLIRHLNQNQTEMNITPGLAVAGHIYSNSLIFQQNAMLHSANCFYHSIHLDCFDTFRKTLFPVLLWALEPHIGERKGGRRGWLVHVWLQRLVAGILKVCIWLHPKGTEKKWVLSCDFKYKTRSRETWPLFLTDSDFLCNLGQIAYAPASFFPICKNEINN